MADLTRPLRRHRLRIELDAHDPTDLAWALRDLAEAILAYGPGHVNQLTPTAHGIGGTVVYTTDLSVTPGVHAEQIRAWARAVEEARQIRAWARAVERACQAQDGES